MSRRDLKADLAILGGGAAGLSVAAGAARLGAKVVLFEPGAMGGECLNSGCVPSKAIIAAGERAAAARSAHRLGVTVSDVAVDFPAVMAHVRSVITAIEPHDSQERFEGMGVTVVREAAHFTGQRTLESDTVSVRAKRIIVATGSVPVIPPIPGVDAITPLTNETVWNLTSLPRALVVVGAGAMGVELGQAFARLGARVTLVERADDVLPGAPALLGQAARTALQADGVDVRTGVGVSRLAPRADAGGEGVVVTLDGPAGTEDIAADHVLFATGRQARTDGLNLDAAGVEADRRGFKVDAKLRTTNKHVYAIGDAVDRERLTHVAGWHASLIVRNLLFRSPTKVDDAVIPKVVYAHPELAWVGESAGEASARLGEKAIRVGRASFSANDRALAEGDTAGAIELVATTRGRILGAAIAGAGAGEAIQLVSQAMSAGLKMRAIASVIAPYPSRGEIVKRAAGDWYEPVVFGKGARTLVHLLSKLP